MRLTTRRGCVANGSRDSRRTPPARRRADACRSRLTPRPPAAPNIQDAFLNLARRERTAGAHPADGRHRFEARIKNFDRFAVIVEQDGADHLIFKHAIASIRCRARSADATSRRTPARCAGPAPMATSP